MYVNVKGLHLTWVNIIVDVDLENVVKNIFVVHLTHIL